LQYKITLKRDPSEDDPHTKCHASHSLKLKQFVYGTKSQTIFYDLFIEMITIVN